MEIPTALQAYEKARQARVEHIQQSCFTMRAAFQLFDGPEKVSFPRINGTDILKVLVWNQM